MLAEAVAIVAEAAAIVAEAAVIVAEAAVIVAEAAVIVAEAAAIVAEALVLIGEEDQAISHHAAAPRALMEDRCLFVVVHRATASGEVGRPMSKLAYSCKSNTQGSKRISCGYTLISP